MTLVSFACRWWEAADQQNLAMKRAAKVVGKVCWHSERPKSCAKETYVISKRDPLHVRKRPILNVKEVASFCCSVASCHLNVKETYFMCERDPCHV